MAPMKIEQDTKRRGTAASKLAPLPESKRPADPEGAHEQGTFERNNLVAAVHDCQVEKQQNENYRVKDDPKSDVHGHGLLWTPALAAGPGRPELECLHLLVEMGLLHDALDLLAVL